MTDGDGDEIFGRIHSVAAASGGDFFLLDLQASTVSWFSSRGEYLGGITSRGEGPGELAGAEDLALAEQDYLLVLDPSNARISAYQPGPNGLKYDGSRRHGIGGADLCALRDRVYVNVLHDSLLIHEVGDSGSPLNSFGRPPRIQELEILGPYFRTLALSMLASGRILCTVDPDLVIAASTSQPRLSAYHPDGTVSWETTLQDFYELRYETGSRGGMRATEDPETGAHIAQTITRWDEETVLVQYEIRKPTPRPDNADYHGVESRFFDISTGTELERRTDLPVIVAVSGDFLYSRRNLPVPQVLVLERN